MNSSSLIPKNAAIAAMSAASSRTKPGHRQQFAQRWH